MRALVFVTAATIILAACGGSEDTTGGASSTSAATVATTAPTTTPAPTTVVELPTLRGSFVLESDAGGRWDDCYGTGGYVDFGAGMDVTVRDSENTIIAVARTRHLTEDDGDDGDAWMSDVKAFAVNALDACAVVFEIPDLPASDFYTVTVGSRGDLAYSADELEATGWTIDLTLG